MLLNQDLTMYLKSSQLNIIKDDLGRSFIYHSLYNNPRLLDDALTSLLEYFSSEPKTIDDVKNHFDGEVEEVINEFIRLGYIVSSECGERKPLKLSQKQFLLKVEGGGNLSRLELAISNACNLACPHCMHFINNDLPKQSKKLNMSIETARKSIDVFVSKVKEQGNNIVRIHFGNGEPLINWETLSFVLDYCSSIRRIEFSYAINTNLILLNREKAEKLKTHDVKISTSLDGTKVGNDLVRIDKKGKGTFDQIVEKIDLLREIGYPIDGFSITITDKNFHHIDESVIDLAFSLGIKEVSIDCDLVSSIDIPISDCVNKIMRLRRYARSREISVYGNWETPFRILMSSSWLEAPHAYCPAVDGSTLEFNVDGSIKVCGHTNTIVGKNCDLGIVLSKNSTYMNLINSRLPGNNGMCLGCSIEGACAGQCHVTIESTKRDDKLMKNMCSLMKLATTELIVEYMLNNR